MESDLDSLVINENIFSITMKCSKNRFGIKPTMKVYGKESFTRPKPAKHIVKKGEIKFLVIILPIFSPDSYFELQEINFFIEIYYIF